MRNGDEYDVTPEAYKSPRRPSRVTHHVSRFTHHSCIHESFF